MILSYKSSSNLLTCSSIRADREEAGVAEAGDWGGGGLNSIISTKCTLKPNKNNLVIGYLHVQHPQAEFMFCLLQKNVTCTF